MADKMLQQAMSAVMEDMGRAAREGKARRFNGPPRPKAGSVDVTVGEPTMLSVGEPTFTEGGQDEGMDPEALAELQASLEVQR